jgi:PAS domain-containing protein
VNEAWLEYRNVQRDDVIGKSWLEEMHAEDQERVQKIMDNSFAKKKEFSIQYRMRIGNDLALILSKGKPNYSHTGQFIGYIGSCVEIPATLPAMG